MKKINVFLMLISFCSVTLAGAASRPEDDRRIEEQKRNKLKSTEVHRPLKESKPSKVAPPISEADFTYIAQLPARQVTYGYDLAKLLVILDGVESDYVDLSSQVKYMKEKKLLPQRLHKDFDPLKPLRRGLVAYTLRKVLDVKGGIFLRIFRNSERYALMELTYEGIMSSGNTQEIISGDELSSAITNAINRMGGAITRLCSRIVSCGNSFRL